MARLWLWSQRDYYVHCRHTIAIGIGILEKRDIFCVNEASDTCFFMFFYFLSIFVWDPNDHTMPYS